VAAAEFVLATMCPEGGPLKHTWRMGTARVDAFLADYAFLIRGLLELHESTGESRWLVQAQRLAEEQEARLGDPEGGYFVAAASEELPYRSKEIFDGALPSGNGVAVQNLLRLAEFTGEERWSERAQKAIGTFSSLLDQRPEAVKTLWVAAHRFQKGRGRSSEAIVSGERADAPEGSFDLGEESRQKISAALSIGEPNEAGWQPFRLALEIETGWHINAPGGDGSGRPVSLHGEAVEIRELRWPEADWMRLSGSFEAIPVYEGMIHISGELRSDFEVPARVWLDAQPCDATRCLPVARIELPLATAAELVTESGDG
jgi:hypothetical protein